MYLVFKLFNSAIFVLINLTVVLYTLQRFFWAMKQHHKIVADITDFNSMIKEDVNKELCITDRLTKLSSKIAALSQRFNAVEESVIEFVRMDHNMESVRVETPDDINEEMNKILRNLMDNKQQRGKPLKH
ncbi:uncharacterized protein LOC122525378 isoform X1 [Polistes fuscatus]|uniref:uncharacterized protein LOC122525378 isoform X1 n=2 Tax=Polistes fuscatus TaxID=30207 RepID=UPI001CAA3008|nr:uncharacterized protein LOC122525378 isoform X1 [Polistes fuscatus]XP_043504059.1 uncharacterized protein LOC122525378 isoform X1 [Polistes fuscatus]